MIVNRGRCARLYVRGRAHFQRDPAVPDVAGQAPQRGPARGVERDVVDDPDAVAEALGTAPLHGLPDRRQAVTLASVDRDVEVLALDVLEGVKVAAWAVPGFRAGDVKTNHPVVAIAHG